MNPNLSLKKRRIRWMRLFSSAIERAAYWTDTYKYAKGEMPEYAAANLDTLDTGATLNGMKINYLVYGASGTAV